MKPKGKMLYKLSSWSSCICHVEIKIVLILTSQCHLLDHTNLPWFNLFIAVHNLSSITHWFLSGRQHFPEPITSWNISIILYATRNPGQGYMTQCTCRIKNEVQRITNLKALPHPLCQYIYLDWPSLVKAGESHLSFFLDENQIGLNWIMFCFSPAHSPDHQPLLILEKFPMAFWSPLWWCAGFSKEVIQKAFLALLTVLVVQDVVSSGWSLATPKLTSLSVLNHDQ